MMNAARYAVGMQGIAVAERAYQQAAAYRARSACSRARSTARCAGSAPIIHHPDVRRMLMTMRAYTEGCRAMAIVAAAALDAAHHHPDAEARKQNQAFYEFMVPLVKGYSTEMSLEVAILGVQVHGGMGFIEETGAAQYLRDAHDPDDLRRHDRDPGQRPGRPQDRARRRPHRQGDRRADRDDRGRARRKRDSAAAQCDAEAPDGGARGLRSTWSTSSPARPRRSPNAVFAGSVPYLMLAGNLVAGWQTGALAAGRPKTAAPRATATPPS